MNWPGLYRMHYSDGVLPYSLEIIAMSTDDAWQVADSFADDRGMTVTDVEFVRLLTKEEFAHAAQSANH